MYAVANYGIGVNTYQSEFLSKITGFEITDDNLIEIEAARLYLGIPKDKTYIMPAGDTREELIKMYPIVFEMCAERGYNMTGRDHIIAYDTKRGV